MKTRIAYAYDAIVIRHFWRNHICLRTALRMAWLGHY